MEYKVIVLGGGIIGTSIAYYLTKLGAQVVLVESKDIAAGTSGSCDRSIMLQSKAPGPTLDLALKGAEMYETLEEELDADLEYRKSGGMILIETNPEFEVIKGLVERQRLAGLDIKLLSGEEARLKQPGLSPSILGATWWANDAEVNPLNVSFAFTRAARNKGAEILLHTSVKSIITSKEKVVGIETENGEKIYADSVVVALGVWTPQLLKSLGITVPIKPRRGQILVTERIPEFLCCNILSGAYISAKLGHEKESEDSMGIGLSMGQTGSGSLLIGGSREFVGYDTSTTHEVIQAIAHRAIRAFPKLSDTRIVRTFSGLRPYTTDGRPIISSVKQWPGLFIAAGHEGDGIALAPITGSIIAHLACDLDPGIDISFFEFHRKTLEIGAI